MSREKLPFGQIENNCYTWCLNAWTPEPFWGSIHQIYPIYKLTTSNLRWKRRCSFNMLHLFNAAITLFLFLFCSGIWEGGIGKKQRVWHYEMPLCLIDCDVLPVWETAQFIRDWDKDTELWVNQKLSTGLLPLQSTSRGGWQLRNDYNYISGAKKTTCVVRQARIRLSLKFNVRVIFWKRQLQSPPVRLWRW